MLLLHKMTFAKGRTFFFPIQPWYTRPKRPPTSAQAIANERTARGRRTKTLKVAKTAPYSFSLRGRRISPPGVPIRGGGVTEWRAFFTANLEQRSSSRATTNAEARAQGQSLSLFYPSFLPSRKLASSFSTLGRLGRAKSKRIVLSPPY